MLCWLVGQHNVNGKAPKLEIRIREPNLAKQGQGSCRHSIANGAVDMAPGVQMAFFSLSGIYGALAINVMQGSPSMKMAASGPVLGSS